MLTLEYEVNAHSCVGVCDPLQSLLGSWPSEGVWWDTGVNNSLGADPLLIDLERQATAWVSWLNDVGRRLELTTGSCTELLIDRVAHPEGTDLSSSLGLPHPDGLVKPSCLLGGELHHQDTNLLRDVIQDLL